MGLGISRKKALQHIASAMSVEILGILHSSEEFDSNRYGENLAK
jgi:hypothetical protein